MVTPRRSTQRGFTLLEVVITLAIFGIFLWIIVVLTADMRTWERRLPVNYMAHPQVAAVLSRLRKDVLDATTPYYPARYPDTNPIYTQSGTTLITYSLQESGFAQTIVYDFSTPGEVRRLAFSAGGQVSDWVARGVPTFLITDFPIPGHPDSVRIRATDAKGQLAIDQILQPRPHQ